MEDEEIRIGMGEGFVSSAPNRILSRGLGSCVAVALYDSQSRIGGMIHVMLPYAGRRKTLYQYADTAIPAIVEEMEQKGALRTRIVAKVGGGAKMFREYVGDGPGVGEQNVISIKNILRKTRIPVIGEDTGGSQGRSVEFHLDSGRLIISTVGGIDREI